jgi:hypothetical protein
MHLELEAREIDMLIEALDCLKTKFAFVKGAAYAERTQRIAKADELEQKLRQAQSRG